MRKGIYYLNNSGSKWVVFDENGKKEKVTLETKTGKKIVRTAIRYSQFGNFASVLISYKGKKIDVFTDTLLED